MKRILFYTLVVCLISSCGKEDFKDEQKLVLFKEVSDTNVSSEYRFKYDSDGRLIEKSTPISNSIISYVDQNISRIVMEELFFSGIKEQNYYYTNLHLDSISIDYSEDIYGFEFIRYYYSGNKCIRKVEYWYGNIINVYDFHYNNNTGYIDEIILERKTQKDTLFYSYEYDINGNNTRISVNDQIRSEFEYLGAENPLYKISNSYLFKVPVDPNYNETELITSKRLIKKAIYYDYKGEIEKEIVNEYNFDDNGLPVSGMRIFNGKEEELIFEYE